jgi:hypothetical protein
MENIEALRGAEKGLCSDGDLVTVLANGAYLLSR